MSQNSVDAKVIYAAVDFIRAMSAKYGSEDGMRIWETVCEAIPEPGVKGQVFLHMLGIHNGTELRVTGTDPAYTDAITQIKTLRTVTNLALKEAKEIVVNKIGYPVHIKATSPEKYDQLRKELAKVGFYVE